MIPLAPAPAASPLPQPRPLLWRVSVLAVLLILELSAFSVWMDNATLVGLPGLAGWIGKWGAWAGRFTVASAVFLVLFRYPVFRALLQDSTAVPRERISLGYSIFHFLAVAGFAGLSVLLYGESRFGIPVDWLAGFWLAAGVAAVVLGGLALAPARSWRQAAQAAGRGCITASTAGAAVCLAGAGSRSMWAPAAHVTFWIISRLLACFSSRVVYDPAGLTVGVGQFQIRIAEQCSGLEGIGLILVFGAIWLWLFRREFRFPQALLLLAGGAAVIFALNALRVTALILIGAAGAERVALGGFHSQAGWIVFLGVAVGFAMLAHRVPWVSIPKAEAAVPPSQAANPVSPYLVPFLAILAAGIISGAASAGFEWLYPLRFIAAAAALWRYRRSYADLDWRFGWAGCAAGGAVFGLWMGLDRLLGGAAASTIPLGLSGLSASGRVAWLAFRTISAVATVPIAEELAFRGYLLRRIASSDFEKVEWRRIGLLPVLISSVAFGALHGDRWLAGILAGAIYAAAVRRQGRIGDAVAAHSVTNALITLWVLTAGRWDLW